MTPTALSYLTLTVLTLALCGLPLFAVAVAIARVAKDTRTVDDGRAFGGDE